MLILLFAATLYTNCLQCVNGKIEVPCQLCKGDGYLEQFNKGCRACQTGLYSPTKFGTGFIKQPCKVCKGKKKLKCQAKKN